MKDYNKNNLFFLLCVFGAALAVFFTVVMLTYVGGAGLWSAVLPVASDGYGIYCLVKLGIKFKKASEIQQEDKE